MSRLACVTLALITAACITNTGTKSDDDVEVDAGSAGSDGGGSGNFTPRAGGWQYNEVTPVSNTCPSNTPTIENGAFVIDQVTAAGFRVVPNDGSAPFACTLSNSRFDCPNRGSAMRDLHPGLDAIVNAQAKANGTFSSTTRGSGRQEATVTCTGTQCNALGGAFPCTIKVDFVIDTI